MIFFYLLACLPAIFGAIVWVVSKRIVWWEWLIGVAIAFLTAGICHAIAFAGLTRDAETWSGQIVKATYHPEWVERYTVKHYRTETYTTGYGKNRQTHTRRVYSHTTTHYETHSKYWNCDIDFGKKEQARNISKKFYDEIVKNFGGKIDKLKGYRSCSHMSGTFHSGDPYDYSASNHTGYIYPAVETYAFENRIKAAPSVFQFAKVPKTEKTFKYPANKNWRKSNRLIGQASKVNILEWDRMNSRLGPFWKVNVILIGFGKRDKQAALWQQAAWIGGKKNDLVLCYGSDGDKTTWSFVFGWTEKEIVKRNLETILMENKVSTELIPEIEQEIKANYVIKEWEKFSYISIEPPWWNYLVLIAVMAATQAVFWIIAFCNKADKKEKQEHNAFLSPIRH